MEAVDEQQLTIESLFRAEFARLVRSLAVADGREQAADAVQDVFVQANRHWPKVAAMQDPAGWVRRVAVNRIANGRRNRLHRTELLAAVRPPDPAQLDPLDLDLLRAVAALPAQQRRCVCLHHIGGYSIDEVAEMLAIAPGTVKSHLHDGRASLRKVLEVSDDE